jgi:hypothetical protein
MYNSLNKLEGGSQPKNNEMDTVQKVHGENEKDDSKETQLILGFCHS